MEAPEPNRNSKQKTLIKKKKEKMLQKTTTKYHRGKTCCWHKLFLEELAKIKDNNLHSVNL